MKNDEICQSCGSPLVGLEGFGITKGTESNGEKSEKYCSHCYEDGDFTKDCSIEEMREDCYKGIEQTPIPDDQKKPLLELFEDDNFLKTLDRWK